MKRPSLPLLVALGLATACSSEPSSKSSGSDAGFGSVNTEQPLDEDPSDSNGSGPETTDEPSDEDPSESDDESDADELSTEITDEDLSRYDFDGAFPTAAALVALNVKYQEESDKPMGWGEANTYTAIYDYMYVTGSLEYEYLIDKIYLNNIDKGEKNFINEFYDDTAWWGLAWIRAYDLTADEKYLDTAKTIADHLDAEGWIDTCDGGMVWNRGASSKNAIATGLFLKLTASLHNRISGDSHYLDLSQKAWTGFVEHGFVFDGIADEERRDIVADGQSSETCEPTGTPFTYNQGVVLGAAAELYIATQDKSYLDAAYALAKSSMNYFSNDEGVLYERHRSNAYDCRPGSDNIYFRGAYLRNLRELNEQLNDDQIKEYIAYNADWVWNHARGELDAMSGCWEFGDQGIYDPSYMTPVLDLMTATAAEKRENKLLDQEARVTGIICKDDEAAAFAVDGRSSTKFCAIDAGDGVALEFDLGQKTSIHRLRMAHSGVGSPFGDSSDNNTRAFEVLVSNDKDGEWEAAATVEDNISNGTSTLINKKARYLRINFTDPGADGIVRIYEIMAD